MAPLIICCRNNFVSEKCSVHVNSKKLVFIFIISYQILSTVFHLYDFVLNCVKHLFLNLQIQFDRSLEAKWFSFETAMQ